MYSKSSARYTKQTLLPNLVKGAWIPIKKANRDDTEESDNRSQVLMQKKNSIAPSNSKPSIPDSHIQTSNDGVELSDQHLV
jgi:hypothetical protein